MYTTIRERLPGRGAADKESTKAPRSRVLASLGPNVYALGLVSLLTDISSEMVASILPLYLVLGLGLSPLQFGIIDGLYNGVSALARLVGGVTADRWRRHKEVAGIGYALSALAKIGMIAAGSVFAAIAAVIAVDRTGKGIRTAPRDALISLSVPVSRLGTAFGVHRAMDNFGAFLGPIVAFTVLALVPGRFDLIFLVSFLFAALGVVALVLFVENHREPKPEVAAEPVTQPVTEPVAAALAEATALDAIADDSNAADAVAATPEKRISLGDALRLLRAPRFRSLSLIAAGLALMTVSDGFLYLVVYERTGLPLSVFPLLFVVTALVYVVLAVPVGRLADRVGRGRVLITGYGLLAFVYGMLLLPSGGMIELPIVVLALAGYYAATDGVLMAMASTELPPSMRASGLALLTTGTAAARLISSVLFGALWVAAGQQLALAAFMVGMAALIGLAAFGFWRLKGADVATAA